MANMKKFHKEQNNTDAKAQFQVSYKLVILSFVILGVMSWTYGSFLGRFFLHVPASAKMLVVTLHRDLRCKESDVTGML